jgi:hypothetical protein
MLGRYRPPFRLRSGAGITIDPVLVRVVTALTVVLWAFGTSLTALALTPRVAICGRVTSFDATVPGGPVVRLGTQEPRHLATGGVPQVGAEICIWGVDVGNFNPSILPEVPNGIAAYSIAPVASIGCAGAVIGSNAFFEMPGEALSPLPNHAFLALPLSAPPGNGCVRIAVDAQGNPVAVVVPRAATASPATSSPSTSVASLPSTSASNDREILALALVAAGAFVAATGLLAHRRTRRAIPS